MAEEKLRSILGIRYDGKKYTGKLAVIPDDSYTDPKDLDNNTLLGEEIVLIEDVFYDQDTKTIKIHTKCNIKEALLKSQTKTIWFVFDGYKESIFSASVVYANNCELKCKTDKDFILIDNSDNFLNTRSDWQRRLILTFRHNGNYSG